MRLGDAEGWRARLSALVFASSHPTVIAAPPGFGVSTIAAHIQSSLQAVPATVLDLDTIDPSALGIGKLLRKHVVFTGREAPDHLSLIPQAQLLDHSILRFTEAEAIEEACRVGVTESVARSIHVFTAGWPDYFLACLAVASRLEILGPSEAYDRLHQGPHVQPLIDACTSELTDRDLAQVGQLTHFTKISPGLIDALLGDKGLSRVRRAGFPIIEAHPGWYEILEPVRSHLRINATLDEQTARKLAPELVADAGMVAGARILLAAGQPAAAATALRSVPVHQLDEGSQSTLLSLLRTVLDTEKDDGSLRLRLARVYHNHGDLGSLRKTLIDATQAAEEQLRPDLQIEANAELLLLDLNEQPHDSIRERHHELSQLAREHGSRLAQIRLREVDVLLEAESGELAKIYQSVDHLVSIANDWELIGEPARASATLRVLAAMPLFHLGRYASAVETAQRACELATGQPQALLKSLTFVGRNQALAARVKDFDETTVRIEELMDGAGLAWIDSYHTWSKMIAAGYRNCVDDVAAYQRRAETLMGSLFTHPTGVIFLTDAAIAFAAAGDLERASVLLDRAIERESEAPLDVGVAQVVVNASIGDQPVHDIARELRAAHEVPLERDWRIDLALALVDGDQDRLPAIAEEAGRHGLIDLFRATVDRHEGEGQVETVRLQLLGEFAIESTKGPVMVPGGKATELVKFLGVRMKPAPVDVVIEHLWGDVSTDVGLRRLKNVVSRARSALGQNAIDRRGQSIGLSSDVVSDLTEVRDLLRGLRSNPRDTDAAIAAVDLYRGPLLELDLYHDWVDSERRSLEASALSSLELVIDASAMPAEWAFEALRRLNPADERPYMATADLAYRQDDETTLRLALTEVRRVCDELEVRLPTGFDRLAARISNNSACPVADGALEGA